MNKRIIFGLVSAAALALFVQAGPAFATTIDLNQVWTGAQPDGSAPWLTATFTPSTTDLNEGTLVLTSNLTGTDVLKGLGGNGKGNVGWAFFLNQSASITSCTGICGNSNSGFNAGGFNTGPVHAGTFNLGFGWQQDVNGYFGAGSTATYVLTFENDLTGNPFVVNSDGWSSVAHVQDIGPNGCSGWIVAGSGTDAKGATDLCNKPHAVPEPAALGMLGFGVLLIGLFAGLRRRYN